MAIKKPHPSKKPFKKEYCKMLIDHMTQGYGYYAFAGKIKVSVEVLQRFEKEYPEWLEAKKQAFSASELYWDKLAVDSCQPGAAKLYNAISIIFNLKNRFPDRWRNEPAPTETTKKDVILKHAPITSPPPKKTEDK